LQETGRDSQPPGLAANTPHMNNTPDTKDAMRYRWLRDRAFVNSPNCEDDFAELARKLANCHGKEFDALIDAAMEEQP